MEWIQATVRTTTAGIDHVTGALLSLNLGGFSIQDPADFTEFLNGDDFHWDYIDEDVMALANAPFSEVVFYLPATPAGSDTMAQVRQILARLQAQHPDGDFGDLRLTTDRVQDEDWAENWKKYFNPIPVGKRLIIKPTWRALPADNTRTALEIDPEMSFGSGDHYTTRLCLELIEGQICGDERVLDMGCGSGILAVGALLLGAASAFAVDIDPLAVETAQKNAAINHVQTRLTGAWGDVLQDMALRAQIGTGYDYICANIVADVIIAMAPLFTVFLAAHGLLTVSGIIEERADEVLDALRTNGFSVVDQRTDGGWYAATLKQGEV